MKNKIINIIIKANELILMGLKENLAYSAVFWGIIIVNVMQITVFYFVWISVFGDSDTLFGFSKAEMISYIILSRFIFLHMSEGYNLRISRLIQSGKISMELLRPFDFQYFLFFNRIGDFISSVILIGTPIMVLSLFFFGMVSPVSFVALIAFVLSFFMAVTISFFIEFMLGLIAFYTTNLWGMEVFKQTAISFLSGALIPIAFFPKTIQTIIDYLPFKSMVYTPIALYLGKINGVGIFSALGEQFIWICVLFIFSRLFFRSALARITVQGG